MTATEAATPENIAFKRFEEMRGSKRVSQYFG